MQGSAGQRPPGHHAGPNRTVVITALGVAQILAWGTSFYFPAVLAEPIARDTGWPFALVVGGTSVGLLVAGLVSPRVGHIIDRRGGRPVLAASALIQAAGLGVIAMAPVLPVYLLGWVIVGVAMGAGTYDAAFAALGRHYGHGARGLITNLTLFGGFASTVCWPLGAWLVAHYDWRLTALVYAGLHLVVALPLQLVMPSDHQSAAASAPASVTPSPAANAAPLPQEWLLFSLIALVMSLVAGIGAIVVVHLLIFLQARGLDFATAVSLGTLFGPAQVVARVVERLFGRHYHPIWTMVGACALMLAGLAMLGAGANALALAVLVYAGGYGVSWIARGTLPLALFGPRRYPVVIGRLAFPSLIVQALAPSAGAWLIARHGSDVTIATLTALAAANVALVLVLWLACRGRNVADTAP